jgi:hypothetical protein
LKHRVLFAVCVLAAVLTTSGSSHGAIIDNIAVTPPDISPNGDGAADSMIITYDLADTANAVYLLIVQSDSTSVVDTLVGGVSHSAGSQGVAVWKGTVASGVRVADDDYFVSLRATNDAESDSRFRPISVDVVPPQAFVTDLHPILFAPGSPDDNQSRELTVGFQTFDPHPSDKINLRVWITDPAGDVVETLLPDTLVQAIGSHTVRWNGLTAADDGIHEVKIFAEDRAGNTDHARSSFRVDLDPPDLEVTSPGAGGRFKVVPDSLYGWAWDSGGDPSNKTVPSIASLYVRYSGGLEAFEPIQTTAIRMDTVFFAVQLTDSVVLQDTTYTLGFRAVDKVGRIKIAPFSITWDPNPPAAPVLDQPPSPTRNPTQVLDGTVSSDTEIMRIYRNDALVDTIEPNHPVLPEWPYPVTLVPGENEIYAIAVDGAGNASASSNVISIVLDASPGLRITQPFVVDDVFLLNLGKPASSVTLRVYDMGGKLVRALSSQSSGSNISIAWDGRNGDGETVRKGPLVAVAQIRYQSGGSEVFREIFLFEP